MSEDFSHNDLGFVNIPITTTETTPWGSNTITTHQRLTLAEVLGRDTNKRSGSEVIKIRKSPLGIK